MTQRMFATLVSIGWMVSAVVLFIVLGATSAQSLAVLAVAGFLPPLVFVAMVSGGPVPVAAEILHTEGMRSDR